MEAVSSYLICTGGYLLMDTVTGYNITSKIEFDSCILLHVSYVPVAPSSGEFVIHISSGAFGTQGCFDSQ